MNPNPSTPATIFIVEDDAFLGSILNSKASTDTLKSHLFTSAEDAFTAMAAKIPDVLILDINLPGMNGLKALEKIRADERLKDIRVLVVSNTDEKKDRDEATRLGAGFLIKAMTEPADIVKAVTDLLATH